MSTTSSNSISSILKSSTKSLASALVVKSTGNRASSSSSTSLVPDSFVSLLTTAGSSLKSEVVGSSSTPGPHLVRQFASVERLWATINALILFVIAHPAYLLYRRGLGFWGAVHEDADVCARLTNVPVTFWQEQHQACALLIRRDFEAHLNTFVGALDFVILARLCYEILQLCKWMITTARLQKARPRTA